MARGKNKPILATRFLKEVTAHLEGIDFAGKPLIDTHMSAAAIDAVLKEAGAAVFAAAKSSDPIADMLRQVAGHA